MAWHSAHGVPVLAGLIEERIDLAPEGREAQEPGPAEADVGSIGAGRYPCSGEDFSGRARKAGSASRALTRAPGPGRPGSADAVRRRPGPAARTCASGSIRSRLRYSRASARGQNRPWSRPASGPADAGPACRRPGPRARAWSSPCPPTGPAVALTPAQRPLADRGRRVGHAAPQDLHHLLARLGVHRPEARPREHGLDRCKRWGWLSRGQACERRSRAPRHRGSTGHAGREQAGCGVRPMQRLGIAPMISGRPASRSVAADRPRIASRSRPVPPAPTTINRSRSGRPRRRRGPARRRRRVGAAVRTPSRGPADPRSRAFWIAGFRVWPGTWKKLASWIAWRRGSAGRSAVSSGTNDRFEVLDSGS